MEKLNKIKSIKSATADSSFEEEANETKLDLNLEFDSETPKKYFEDFNLDEIYNFIKELDKSEYIDMNLIFKKEKETSFLPNENNDNNDNNNFNECKEILNIVCNKKTPFKPLKEPKKVNLKGKVFINDEKDNVIRIN